ERVVDEGHEQDREQGDEREENRERDDEPLPLLHRFLCAPDGLASTLEPPRTFEGRWYINFPKAPMKSLQHRPRDRDRESSERRGTRMIRISRRVASSAESATLALTARVQELKRKGVDVMSFGAGEPDFPTPPHVKAAGVKAIDENFTRY